MKADVAFEACSSYDMEEVEAALRAVLEPVDGVSGIIPNTYASRDVNGTLRAGSREWPWEQYKAEIVTAEIKSEIRTYGLSLPGMFEGCSNLVSVDVSGLNVSRVDSTSSFSRAVQN